MTMSLRNNFLDEDESGGFTDQVHIIYNEYLNDHPLSFLFFFLKQKIIDLVLKSYNLF